MAIYGVFGRFANQYQHSMNAAHVLLSSVERRLSRTAKVCTDFLRSAAFKADAEAMVFSAKSFLAATIAYYIALRIGLPKPYWAIVTVYIVSQTTSGPSFSRGVYRLAGTIVGAAATVLIISTFVGEPVVCGAVLSGWIGLCLFLSLLDRTPRAYAYVLAGYTASLIGFPGVADPAAIFDTASLRVQEIGLGVICAVLVHRFILPRPITGQFIGKLSATLKDARRLVVDAMDGVRVAATPNPPGFRYPVPLDRLTVKNEPTSSHLRRLSGESAVAFGKRCPLHRRLRKTGCMMKPCWAIETGSIKRPNRAGAYECENSSRFQRPSSRHPGSRSWPFRRGSACSDVSGGPGRGRGAGPAA